MASHSQASITTTRDERLLTGTTFWSDWNILVTFGSLHTPSQMNLILDSKELGIDVLVT